MKTETPWEIKPSPLTGRELLVVTDNEHAISLLRSLKARHAPAHGWFIQPGKARMFEALWEAEVVALSCRRYRFPDGSVRDIYASTRHIRRTMGVRVMA